MELSEARANYIFTTRIDFDNDDFIVLKEPTAGELKDFGDEGKQNIDILMKLFPKSIVESSFTEDGKPARSEKVAALFLDSGTQFYKIIETWMDSLPLKKTKDGNSDKQESNFSITEM